MHSNHTNPPHHHHPHHGPHGPKTNHLQGSRKRGRAGCERLFSETIIGPTLYGLLIEEPKTSDELQEILEKESPADLEIIEAILESTSQGNPVIEEQRSSPTQIVPIRSLLMKAAAMKAQAYYGRIITRIDVGDFAIDQPVSSTISAAILPLPPHLTYIVEGATAVFLLPGHDVPPHLGNLEIIDLPTRSGEIRNIFANVAEIAFEAFVGRGGKLTTRREIAHLFQDLMYAGFKPTLLVHNHPLPPHEEQCEIGDAWEHQLI